MSKHFISLITVLALISVSGCATTNNISLNDFGSGNIDNMTMFFLKG